ncbi:hypothetical protein M422DRAFT_79461, partial [Sphaerobolus stellatus SS14]
NELADADAKRTATGDISNRDDLPYILRQPLPISIAVLKSERKKSKILRWRALWITSPRFNRLSKVDSTMP